MAHIYKTAEWAGATGKWYVNDTSDLAGIAGKWWIPARILGLSLTDYILLLKDEYGCIIKKYNAETDYLEHYWLDKTLAHKWVLFINKRARAINFIV